MQASITKKHRFYYNSLRSNHNLFLALLGSNGIHVTGLHNQDITKVTVFW